MQLFRSSSCILHVTNIRAKSLENRVLFRTTATILRHSYTSPATTTIVRHSHTTPATRTLIGTLFSPINPPISTHLSIISASPHSFSRWLSRAINIALKRRPKKVKLPRSMRLIDEQGTNLGVVSSEIAVKLAESKNLKLLEVQRAASPDSEGVYRLFTSKQQWEEGKKRKKSTKPDPINTTKDITIFSQIGEHDLAVKMSHLHDFLTRGHSARVFVQTKYRRGMSEERERGNRETLVGKIETELAGLGEKVSQAAHQRRGVVCQFRPLRKKNQTHNTII